MVTRRVNWAAVAFAMISNQSKFRTVDGSIRKPKYQKKVKFVFGFGRNSGSKISMPLTGVLANERLAKCCQMSTLFFSFADEEITLAQPRFTLLGRRL